MNDGLGAWLRRTREQQQLTLADIEKALRIRRRYLQALEVSDYAALPGEIQARGFLRNYARFLKLPVEEALARYDSDVRGVPLQPRARSSVDEMRSPVFDRRTPFRPPQTEAEEIASVARSVPKGMVLAVWGAFLFFGIVFVATILALVFLDLEPESVMASPTPVLTIALTEALSTPTPESTLVIPEAVDGKVRVRLVAQESAWISVSADQQIVFQGIADTDKVMEVTAEEIMIIATGNGGAFQLYLNGVDLGLLGEIGEAVRRAWGPDGEIALEGL